MTDELRGPWKTLTGDDGTPVPFYVIPFDKAGTCTGPRTLEHLLGAAKNATDVYVFSHGWNNDWGASTRRYDRFVQRFIETRRARWNPPDREFRPVLVGVFWPSTALVADDEREPDIAAGGPDGAAESEPSELSELGAVADAFGGAPPARLYELAQKDRLTSAEAEEFARLLAPVLSGDDELGGVEQVTAEQLLEVWRALPADGAPAATGTTGEAGGFIEDGGGFIDDGAPAGDRPPPAPGLDGPATAGIFEALNPRNIIRTATVLLMKDRAGTVGGKGVAVMLRQLLAASDTSRLHLAGHSYGCRVVLSALSAGAAPERDVESVLLLQPATSALCFARDAGGGKAGGYRVALDRSRQPIVTTFSAHDIPLTRLFHLAARRESDLGDAVIAGAPSKYAALGGFGPQGVGSEAVTVTPVSPPQRYDVTPRQDRRIVAIKADSVIANHGSVENAATAWALLCQTMG